MTERVVRVLSGRQFLVTEGGKLMSVVLAVVGATGTLGRSVVQAARDAG